MLSLPKETKLNDESSGRPVQVGETKNLSWANNTATHSLKPCRKGYGMPMVLTQRACTDHTDRTDRTDRTNTSILFLEQNHLNPQTQHIAFELKAAKVAMRIHA